MRAALLPLAASLLLACAPVPAKAPTSAPEPSPKPALSDEETTRRLTFIEDHFRKADLASQLWWHGSLAGWGAITLGQAALALSTNDVGVRKDYAVGAVSSSLGVAALAVFPYPQRYANASLASLPESTPAERTLKLSRAEAFLRASAKADAEAIAWPSHLLAAGVATGFGLLRAFAYHRPVTGLLSIAEGVALTEAQILTRPTSAIDVWKAYQGRINEVTAPRTASSIRIAPAASGIEMKF